MNTSDIRPHIGILVAHIAAAAGSVVYSGFCKKIDILTFIFLQSLLAALYTTLGAFFNNSTRLQKTKDIFNSERNTILVLSLCYGLGIFLYFVFFFYALKGGSPAHVTLLLSLQSAFAVTALWLFFKVRPARRLWFITGMIISIIGAVLFELDTSFDDVRGIKSQDIEWSQLDWFILGVLVIATGKAMLMAKVNKTSSTLFPHTPEGKTVKNQIFEELVSTFASIICVALCVIAFMIYGAEFGAAFKDVRWLEWPHGRAAILLATFFLGVIPVGFVEAAFRKASKNHVLEWHSLRVFIPLIVYLLSLLAVKFAIPVEVPDLTPIRIAAVVVVFAGTALAMWAKHGKSV